MIQKTDDARTEHDFTKFAVCCSECGHHLSSVESAKGANVRCPKCGATVEYTVDAGTVTVKLLEPSKRRLKSMKAYSKGLR